MGEFEFALVFFQRGQSIRKDMVAFRDGVTKCKSAILDAINGEELFTANPNFAASRPRVPLVEVSPEKKEKRQEDPEKLQRTAELLPEKVEPLPITLGCKEFLGELSLDYEYLLELQEEINGLPEDGYGKEEDKKILEVVDDALTYLDQRSAFWSQQDGGGVVSENESADSPQKKSRSTKRSASTSPSSPNRKQKAHYEMSKIQQYEAKYGRDQSTRASRTPDGRSGIDE